jgi:hypothetical protein
MRRPVLVLLVATLLLAGGGMATAAWRTTNTGSAAARAGSIGTPTEVTIGTSTCTGGGSSIPVSWAVVEGAAQYTIESSPLGLFVVTQSQTVTTASATLSAGGSGSIFVRVRATAGKWTSGTSTVVSRRISC